MTKILIDEATVKLALEVLKINFTLLKKITPYKGQEDLLSDPIDLTNKAIAALKALAEQPAQQKPACFNGLVDTDGENKAVRCLLMLYGERGLTVGAMKTHLSMSGFKMWPDWVEREPDGAHLTKSGAQLWIRHLFSLEQPAQQEPFAWANKDDICYDTAFRWCEIGDHKTPLYTSPPAQHKPLTNEQFQAICDRLSRQGGWDGDGWDLALKEAIEAAHGIKENT